jgi:hypothetical protein
MRNCKNREISFKTNYKTLEINFRSREINFRRGFKIWEANLRTRGASFRMRRVTLIKYFCRASKNKICSKKKTV